jgi:hypothetical protein
VAPISKRTTLAAEVHCLALTASSLAVAQVPPPAVPAPPACAVGTDIVDRKDGGMLRGTIIDSIPGGRAQILLATCEIVTVPWADIARVERSPAPVVTVPSSSAAPAPAAAATVDGPLIPVHIEGSRALLERDSTGFNRDWEPVCKAPCDKALSVAYSYRVAGDGIRNSVPFALDAPPGQHEILHVSEGDKAGFVYGIVATAGGGAATVAGLLMVILGAYSKAETESVGDVPGDQQVITAGLITGALGAALVVGGLALTLSNARSTVSPAIAAQAWIPARAPQRAGATGFRDGRREIALAMPPLVDFPIFGGSF